MDPLVSRFLSVFKYLILLVICGGFLGMGMQELVGVPWIKEQFTYWMYPLWFMYLVGFVQVAGSIATFYKPTRIWGASILLLTMVGAIGTHFYFNQYDWLIPPIVLLALLILLIFIEKMSNATLSNK